MNKKSTNNISSFKVPKSILLTGKILQTISNDLATRFAAKIFATPIKFKVPERELMMRKSAKKDLVEIASIKKEIMVYSYGYSKKKVLLVHGWAGRGTQLFQLADKILENKMMVITFDGPAHGLSSGKTTLMTEFIETIHHLEKKFGPFDMAVGHSFGAMALLNAVKSGLNIKKLVTIGADNSITEITKQFVQKLQLNQVISHKMVTFYEKKHSIKADQFSSQNAAKKVKIPTLVIHDSDDKFVPVSSAFEIRQNLDKGELLITNGLGHHKIFKNQQIINRIIDFIK
ncbi:MAG: alpha/beta hydrolase [Flavobacteriaceae bacterium]|nr:alpha/beta hydrolase [Flavobacteriaceae bacterium]